MAKPKASTRKSKRKNKRKGSFKVFLIIVILLALVSFAITYIVMNADNNSDGQKDNYKQQDKGSLGNEPSKNDTAPMPKITFSGESIEKGNLDGTWVSENDGSMLTITGRKYSIELPNVDGTIVDRGTIVVLKNKVTFVDTDEDSPCTASAGVYGYKLKDNTIIFNKIDDKCDSRNYRMTAKWYKI